MGLRVTKQHVGQIVGQETTRKWVDQSLWRLTGAEAAQSFTWRAWSLVGTCLLAAASALPAAAEPETLAESTTPGVPAPYCADQTQQGLNRCAATWLRTAEYLQSLVYDDLHQGLELSDRVQLAIAQEHWSAFREAQCALESDSFIEGSIYPLIYGSCMAQTANDRTADLQGWGNGDLPVDAAEKALEDLLAQHDLADSEAQKQWEAYRNLHCDFEAAYQDPVPDQYRQCVSRLTQTRAARLEAFVDQLDN